MKPFLFKAALLFGMTACTVEKMRETKQMVVLDPAHFHAALLQKYEIPGVSDTVLVFASEGKGLQDYLAAVESFNSREDNPTHWVCKCYTETDWLEVFPKALPGDFVVLAGNNRNKTDYILKAIEKGYNVLSDKPMAIKSSDYEKLQEAYDKAKKKHLILYDLMTERYDLVFSIFSDLVADRELTGNETEEEIEIEDVHHFCKSVNGKTMQRPWWYYDIRCQGEGIADVSTHYIDLTWVQCFPNTPIHVEDVKLDSAWHYPTVITPKQYRQSTGLKHFPKSLRVYVNKDGNLEVYCNGGMEYTTFGQRIKFEVRWDFQAEEGSGDTYRCSFPFETAVIKICQNEQTDWQRQIFIDTDEEHARAAEAKLREKYDFVSFEAIGRESWMVSIPQEVLTSHEEHFNQVGRMFISMIDGTVEMPEWERVNTLTKYYLTTEAVRLANIK